MAATPPYRPVSIYVPLNYKSASKRTVATIAVWIFRPVRLVRLSVVFAERKEPKDLQQHHGTECKGATKETNHPTAPDVVNRTSDRYVASTHRTQADDACTSRPKSLVARHDDSARHRVREMAEEPVGFLLRFPARRFNLGGGSVEGLEGRWCRRGRGHGSELRMNRNQV